MLDARGHHLLLTAGQQNLYLEDHNDSTVTSQRSLGTTQLTFQKQSAHLL